MKNCLKETSSRERETRINVTSCYPSSSLKKQMLSSLWMTFFNPYKVDIIWKLKTQISRLKSAFQMKLTVISSVLPAKQSKRMTRNVENDNFLKDKIRHSKVCQMNKNPTKCDDYWTNTQNTKKLGSKMWWLLNKQPKTQRNLDPKCDEYWTNNQNLEWPAISHVLLCAHNSFFVCFH